MRRHLATLALTIALAGCGLGRPAPTAADASQTNDHTRDHTRSRATAIASYACDAWGYLTVSVILPSGAEHRLVEDVGAAEDCRWFLDNYAPLKTYVRAPTTVAACDTWGYMTKIRVSPDAAPVLLGRPDVGTKDECLQQAALLNGADASRPTAVAAYSCDAWGYLRVTLSTVDGRSLEAVEDVGSADDCRWFTSNYADRKSRIRDTTLIAACDTWGYITKIRLDPYGPIDILPKVDVGSQDDCLAQARLINGAP